MEDGPAKNRPCTNCGDVARFGNADPLRARVGWCLSCWNAGGARGAVRFLKWQARKAAGRPEPGRWKKGRAGKRGRSKGISNPTRTQRRAAAAEGRRLLVGVGEALRKATERKNKMGSTMTMPAAPLVLVCGDRNWTDRDLIRARLAKFPADAIVMHGGCRGADEIAGDEAEKRGLKVRVFPAKWEEEGKAAGPKRNARMLDERPLFVLAFHDNIAFSRGTADCVRQAQERGIPVQVMKHNTDTEWRAGTLERLKESA